MKENVRKWWLDMRWVNCINRDKIKTNKWYIPIMIGDSDKLVKAAMQWREEIMKGEIYE